MTDFKIDTEQGLGQLTFEESGDIMNNIYLSLMVRKGSFFQNRAFGSRLHELYRSKNTEQIAALVEDYCKEALQWIIDIGRASKIEVYTEIDKSENPHRLKLIVECTQVDGRVITFDIFMEVI